MVLGLHGAEGEVGGEQEGKEGNTTVNASGWHIFPCIQPYQFHKHNPKPHNHFQHHFCIIHPHLHPHIYQMSLTNNWLWKTLMSPWMKLAKSSKHICQSNKNKLWWLQLQPCHVFVWSSCSSTQQDPPWSSGVPNCCKYYQQSMQEVVWFPRKKWNSLHKVFVSLNKVKGEVCKSQAILSNQPSRQTSTKQVMGFCDLIVLKGGDGCEADYEHTVYFSYEYHLTIHCIHMFIKLKLQQW